MTRIGRFLKRLICAKKGHIPIHDGHVTNQVYGWGLVPDFQKLDCSRCSATVILRGNSTFSSVPEREEYSKRCLNSLKVHKILGD